MAGGARGVRARNLREKGEREGRLALEGPSFRNRCLGSHEIIKEHLPGAKLISAQM